jgi:putative ATP-dependent endonuclease of the OLD family
MLKRISIKNYRSFGREIVLDELEKINILIGPNNSGKSNILRFLNKLAINKPLKSGSLEFGLTEEDYLALEPGNYIEFRIDFDLPDGFGGEPLLPFEFRKFYLNYQIIGTQETTSINLIDSPIHSASEVLIREFVQKKMGISGGSFEDRRNDAIRAINPEDFFTFPDVVYLDEFRKLSGNKDLVVQLHSIIHSDYKHQRNKRTKERLNKFISEVFNEPIIINIPDTKNDIELIIKDQQLPLTSFGTGLQEIIILGFYLITHSDSIVCIDEPELHLHPAVQRAFLKFISDNTSHQYFISTHSNSFLDYEVEKTIYSAKLIDNNTSIFKCSAANEISGILSELGIRASEIIQTNGIIWVEGPSDRIYIKKWLELCDSAIKEGFHYSFQYYGGKVLCHYSVNDLEFEEFINMLFVNRNGFLVMDSDMAKNYEIADLRETKQRIVKEADEGKFGYWVTAGREIENYLTNSVLEKFAKRSITRSRYGKISTYCKEYKDKVRGARKIVEEMGAQELESNYDLSDKIRELLGAIKKWNGIA